MYKREQESKPWKFGLVFVVHIASTKHGLNGYWLKYLRRSVSWVCNWAWSHMWGWSALPGWPHYQGSRSFRYYMSWASQGWLWRKDPGVFWKWSVCFYLFTVYAIYLFTFKHHHSILENWYQCFLLCINNERCLCCGSSLVFIYLCCITICITD